MLDFSTPQTKYLHIILNTDFMRIHYAKRINSNDFTSNSFYFTFNFGREMIEISKEFETSFSFYHNSYQK